MIDRTPQLPRVLVFLREHAGAAFCFECIANAVTAAGGDVAGYLQHAVQRARASVDLGRGRCSVCRAETEVARHTLH